MKSKTSALAGHAPASAGNFSTTRAESMGETGQSVLSGEMRIAEPERDDVLLWRAANGDEEAFTLLYRRHQAAMYRFALRMTGNTWAAEEIVQDVFMTLMRDPKKYDVQRGTLGGFLYGIARNRVMKHLERRPREVALEEKNEDGTGSGIVLQDVFTPANWTETRERKAQVRAAVLELPAEFREAVVLCELEEMSYEEAAQAAGCPIGTIRSRLHRGRALLLAKLEMLRDVPRRASVAR
ncbi:MAG TPA: sigma-70 family RNA polymerase sigma factor [Candidatus Acidoferrum sp.]